MLGYDIDNLALYFVGDSGQKEVRSVWTLNAVCLTFCASCFGAIAFAGAAGMVIAFALIWMARRAARKICASSHAFNWLLRQGWAEGRSLAQAAVNMFRLLGQKSNRYTAHSLGIAYGKLGIPKATLANKLFRPNRFSRA
ncbi:hypothetical protein [Thiobacillus sp. 65-1402]|uniref:hypothetical protein n=1 Tax=Thiobacillus sp. 65-1402 TaxID=1895861 RepID=UPI0025D0AE81|nr:hypothetical protein [Thiobacillus sp. 65-1402]